MGLTGNMDELFGHTSDLATHLDHMRRLHDEAFSTYCKRTMSALGEIGTEPGSSHHDGAWLDLADRSLRLVLQNYDAPVGSNMLRPHRNEIMMDLFELVSARVVQWMKGAMDPMIAVPIYRAKLKLAQTATEMICTMVEQTDIMSCLSDQMTNTLSDLATLGALGDWKTREEDLDVAMNVRIAHSEIAELGMAITLRISKTFALIEHHQMTAAAAVIRGA